MRSTPNLLLIVLDALREERRARQPRRESAAFGQGRDLPGGGPLDPPVVHLPAHRDRRHAPRPLLDHEHAADEHDARRPARALPAGGHREQPRPLGACSGLAEGFHHWKFHQDHLVPFERALELIPTATSRKPLFLVLHSNIPHDYYLDVAAPYYEEAYPEDPEPPFVLGDRVITWRDTDAAQTRCGAARLPRRA